MRYPADEKLEVIRLVERSSRPAKWTLDKLGIPRATFYRWYDRYLDGGADALIDRAPMPKAVWNRIPDSIRAQLLDMRSTNRSYHLVSWQSVLRIPGAILSLKALCTGF